MKYTTTQIIKKAWANKYNICIGIFNWIFKRFTPMANGRMTICKACEHFDTSGEHCCVPNTQPCCKLCGCKLSWKVRAKYEHCDINKW